MQQVQAAFSRATSDACLPAAFLLSFSPITGGLKVIRKRAGRGGRKAVVFGKPMVPRRLQLWLENNLGIASLKRHRQNNHTVPVVSSERRPKLGSKWRERAQKSKGVTRKQRGVL